ncbi:hypothetical protein [Nonlabens agnitus]|uniref:hypothetical protein n=1 Tax=Nonlabens agnitus TaxID=870484 RepID=UPI00155881CF|nr:hypothetical protein [Nonlabens agnitus]
MSALIEQKNREKYAKKFAELSTEDQKTLYELANVPKGIALLRKNKSKLMMFAKLG